MENVCDQILGFPEMEMYSSIEQWESYWQNFWLDQNRKNSPTSNTLKETDPSQKHTPQSDSQSSKKKLSYKEQREYEQMETLILSKESRLEELTHASQDPKLASNAVELNKILTELSTLQSEVDQLYSRWAELENRA
jgi:ATP-binding cassette subfamily F protein uup